MHRSKMSVEERNRRSRLTQIIHSQEFVRGTLQIRWKVCGSPNCKCIQGQKHPALYLISSKDGCRKQLYIPKRWEGKVREWVKQYKDMQERLEEISCICWDKIWKREE